MVDLKPIVAFSECVNDSPKFRHILGCNETNLDELEVRIEKVVKACNAMTAGGRQYVMLQSQFLASLWEMSSYFAACDKDPVISPSVDGTANNDTFIPTSSVTVDLNNLIHNLQEFVKFQNALVDQVTDAVGKGLSNFLRKRLQTHERG